MNNNSFCQIKLIYFTVLLWMGDYLYWCDDALKYFERAIHFGHRFSLYYLFLLLLTVLIRILSFNPQLMNIICVATCN